MEPFGQRTGGFGRDEGRSGGLPSIAAWSHLETFLRARMLLFDSLARVTVEAGGAGRRRWMGRQRGWRRRARRRGWDVGEEEAVAAIVAIVAVTACTVITPAPAVIALVVARPCAAVAARGARRRSGRRRCCLQRAHATIAAIAASRTYRKDESHATVVTLAIDCYAVGYMYRYSVRLHAL